MEVVVGLCNKMRRKRSVFQGGMRKCWLFFFFFLYIVFWLTRQNEKEVESVFACFSGRRMRRGALYKC